MAAVINGGFIVAPSALKRMVFTPTPQKKRRMENETHKKMNRGFDKSNFASRRVDSGNRPRTGRVQRNQKVKTLACMEATKAPTTMPKTANVLRATGHATKDGSREHVNRAMQHRKVKVMNRFVATIAITTGTRMCLRRKWDNERSPARAGVSMPIDHE